MHNALRLITTGTVLTLTIALATEQGIAESTSIGTASSTSTATPASTAATAATAAPASPASPASQAITASSNTTEHATSPAASSNATDSATQHLIEQAETQLQRGETQTAISTLNQAVTADPASSLARTRLGGAYLLSQDYPSAVEQFQQAISLDTQNAGAFIGLGMAYVHLKQAGPAKAALSEAKRLNPAKSTDIDALLARIEQTASAHPPIPMK
ncbi:tetratricopeptide repeat protein [Halochromatium roseum]|uniref:tetratricopeptide repeat protein n=1 Tax=Halochromatium roseum TaxID=391920 RepID=UPI001914D2FD|nr:tetratricopeptide repeat protein [Halochromatium roseum]MBK5940964.1 hypothetical protein [Halochromatium roseum]